MTADADGAPTAPFSARSRKDTWAEEDDAWRASALEEDRSYLVTR